MFSTPENFLVGISGALGMKESHFPRKMCFEEMVWGISEMVNASRLICHIVCTGMQGISALILGGGCPLAKVGSSAKFCVLVFKASLLWYWGMGGPLAKVGSSAMLCVLEFKASLLWYWGDFWSSRNERKFTFQVLKTVYWGNAVWYLRNWPIVELSNLCGLCSAPLKTYW